VDDVLSRTAAADDANATLEDDEPTAWRAASPKNHCVSWNGQLGAAGGQGIDGLRGYSIEQR
jgi:hypothetical protein